MKRLFAIALMGAFSCCLHAQAVDTTVCEILKNPVSFNGKIVKIKGTVAAGFDQFVVKGADCGQKVDAIWLSYPEGTKAKAGPATVLELQPAKNFTGTVAAAEQRAAVTLEKSKDFKQFDSLLSTPFKGDGVCLGCGRYTVTATLVGRLDGVKAGIQRDKAGKITAIDGFGNLNAYSARLVLQSVSEIAPQEIDYSKSAAATKGEVIADSSASGTATTPVPGEMHLDRVGGGSSDPLSDAHNTAAGFGAGNSLGAKIERAAAAFGKKGEDNGVWLSFGNGNQAIAVDEGKGSHDSPDGVLYNVKLNLERLKGPAPSIVIAYAGTIIADQRDAKTAQSYAGSYDNQYYGFQTAVLGAIGSRLKTLTLPGGYLILNRAWPPADIEKNMEDGIKSYLDKEELLTR
ncbi:MAG TPA: hypothetical protein VGF01_21540 [Terracidiphilus sp.]|jgi:hypothetical protein